MVKTKHPKKLVCYNLGKIYVLTFQGRIVYVGSSVRVLRQRMHEHWHNRKRKSWIGSLYPFMCGTSKSDWKIELLYNFPCASKKQLVAEEGKATRALSRGSQLLNIRGMSTEQEVPIKAFVQSSVRVIESPVAAIVLV